MLPLIGGHLAASFALTKRRHFRGRRLALEHVARPAGQEAQAACCVRVRPCRGDSRRRSLDRPPAVHASRGLQGDAQGGARALGVEPVLGHARGHGRDGLAGNAAVGEQIEDLDPLGRAQPLDGDAARASGP